MSNENSGADKAAAPGNKFDRETAESEFNKFCDSNRIERDESAMNDEEKESFAGLKNRVIGCIMEGRVEVEGTSIKYTVSDFSPEGFKGKVITIKRPAGLAFSSMDGFKDTQDVHKLLGFISSISGQEIKFFSKVDIIDWKFFNAVASLFLSL